MALKGRKVVPNPEFLSEFGFTEEEFRKHQSAWKEKYGPLRGTVSERNFEEYLSDQGISRLTPGDKALGAADDFRSAILQERIAQRKREQQLEMRSQRAAQAAARMRMTGGLMPQKGGTIMTGPLGVLKARMTGGLMPQKGGTIMTGPLGVLKARMSATPVGILDYRPTATMQQGGSRTATGFNQPVVTPPRMATGFSTPQAVMSSRMENVRLASSSRGGTFSRGT